HVLEWTPGVDGSQKIFEFMETQGSVWGARREVIMRATAALNEFVESAAGLVVGKGNAQTEVRFDDFNLRLRGRHPTEDALLADDKSVASLSGFLIRQYADRVKAETANGRCRIQMHVDPCETPGYF